MKGFCSFVSSRLNAGVQSNDQYLPAAQTLATRNSGFLARARRERKQACQKRNKITEICADSHQSERYLSTAIDAGVKLEVVEMIFRGGIAMPFHERHVVQCVFVTMQ